MNTSSISIIATRQTAHVLYAAIKKKQVILAHLSSRYELLRFELDQIKREYYLRIGSLIERDNRLDIDIIRFKTLLSLMKTGLSYEEANREIRNKYYYEAAAESIGNSKYSTEDNPGRNGRTPSKLRMLKMLWKKAVVKFHPDLALDDVEKKYRENLMRKINKAYADYNTAALEDILQNTFIGHEKEATIEELEKLLVSIENKIISAKKRYNDLKKSEWYGWKKKMKLAKKSDIDIFGETENALLDDIVRKMRIVSELKQEIQNI